MNPPYKTRLLLQLEGSPEALKELLTIGAAADRWSNLQMVRGNPPALCGDNPGLLDEERNFPSSSGGWIGRVPDLVFSFDAIYAAEVRLGLHSSLFDHTVDRAMIKYWTDQLDYISALEGVMHSSRLSVPQRLVAFVMTRQWLDERNQNHDGSE